MTYQRPSYRPSRPSASMIHEIRMIAQSFLRHRTTKSFFQPEQKITAPMLCIPCFRDGKRSDAIAIDGGRSVCLTHISGG